MKPFEKSEKLPQYFQPILWSYNLDDIDPKTDASLIITQTINYGTLKHWGWIKKRYGAKDIKTVLSAVPATALRLPAQKLASVIFKATNFNHAPRSTNQRS